MKIRRLNKCFYVYHASLIIDKMRNGSIDWRYIKWEIHWNLNKKVECFDPSC